jgi:glucose-6-phosphate isomerase
MSEGNMMKLDVSRVFSDAVGEHGLEEKALEALAPDAAAAHKAVEGARGTGMLGWTELPHTKDAVNRSREVWAKVGDDIEDLVIFGIGGSALGTTCVATALLHPMHNYLSREARGGRPRIWVLDNIDPDWIAAHLDFIDPAKTVFSVNSKSGTTAETMSQFLVARKMLEEKLGPDYRRHIVCTTDPEGGKLRKIAADEGFETLPVPQGVGGRFSVLSSVGIFPAVAAGVDVDSLLAGAAAMDERCGDADMWKNPALLQAAILHALGAMGVNIHVMMPYSQALRDYADWYKQLLAESLGKRAARDGSVVHAGPTPAKALGVTDQHSQIQLYTEGPFDKLITIIQIEKFVKAMPLPSVYEGIDGVSYLGGHTLAELMAAESAGTQVALEQGGRPFNIVTVPEVNAHVLGQLFAWAEFAIAYGGEFLNIDAFDQPGVEAGKRAAYALMGRKGFEELKAELEKRAAPSAKHVV